jgi:hypothetical protein
MATQVLDSFPAELRVEQRHYTTPVRTVCFLAVSGIFALAVHGLFLLQGGTEFKAPASILLLISVGAVSIAQFMVTCAQSQTSNASQAEVGWIPGVCGKLGKASYGDPECRHL